MALDPISRPLGLTSANVLYCTTSSEKNKKPLFQALIYSLCIYELCQCKCRPKHKCVYSPLICESIVLTSYMLEASLIVQELRSL